MGEFTDITVGGNDEIIDNRWIEWDHFAIPNKPIWFRKIMRKLMAALNHCLVCTSLDACYFLGRKAPNFPLHHNCDCKIKRILHNKVKNKGQAEMAIEKFTKYVFAENGIKNGKKQIFNDLGYSADNATIYWKYSKSKH